jgi:hypothetical protein
MYCTDAATERQRQAWGFNFLGKHVHGMVLAEQAVLIVV